ncbi:hypothetical protein DL768_005276 [Monosporascus sp. mg162]|nr:hypothetical protein DL768_005276 [Monosporascus sp. mg162]
MRAFDRHGILFDGNGTGLSSYSDLVIGLLGGSTPSSRLFQSVTSILSPPSPADPNENTTKSPFQAATKSYVAQSFAPPANAPLIHPTPTAPPERQQSNTERPQAGGLGGGVGGFADEERKPLMAAPLESKKPPKVRPPMRSSIACLRCRRSKIKCENNGGNPPCDSCIKTGKECVFKVPEANPTPPKRTDPPSGIKQERDGGSERKKLRKFDEFSKIDHEKASVYAEEVLAAPFLTEDLWEQVLDLYKLHFAPELPFLHLPTMKEKLGRRFRSSQADPDFNFVLLGVLTLTARFHPDLVKYLAHVCNNQPGNARSRPIQTQIDPTAASEYYADILTTALGPLRTAFKTASLERVQAWLMLGLYEWSQTTKDTGGLGAWMCVGNAIRLAQYLGLGFGDLNSPSSGSGQRTGGSQGKAAPYQSQVALDKEVKRRTMFSCFILDRMLSCGKERVVSIQRNDLQIQLPCSEDKFDLAMEAQTGFLRDRGRGGTDDSVLRRFILLVDIWGEVSRYSSEGGRLNEEHPPWDGLSTFYRLDRELQAFDKDLPDTFTFSRSNYFKHENHQASSVYVLLHMLRSLCQIMLHREYIPFIPIRCKEPEGPLDRPLIPKEDAPAGWWRRSAEQVFKPARDIVDLIEICQRKDKLPQSTLVLFAIWTASFVGLYAYHFPQMDTESHMLNYNYKDSAPDTPKPDVLHHGPTALTYTTLQKMSTWLNMADTYVSIFRQMDNYFVTIKHDFHKFSKQGEASSEKARLSIRRGGSGGGLEEYQQMLGPLKGFGPLRPEEHAHLDNSERSRADAVERSSSVGPDAHAVPPLSRTATSTPTVSFTAINHTPILPAQPGRNQGTPYWPLGLQGSHPDSYADSWRCHGSPRHQPPLPHLHSCPPTPATILEPTTVAQQALDRVAPHCDNHEDFFKQLEKQAPRRWSTTGDLRLLATGETQDFDLLFAGEPLLSPSTDSPYPYVEQAANY